MYGHKYESPKLKVKDLNHLLYNIVIMFENLTLFIAGQEWIILIVVVVVLIFGARKIPELARTFGKAKGEFEKGKIEGEKELNKYKDEKS